MTWKDIPGFSSFIPVYREAVDHFGDGAVFVEVGVALGHSIAALARFVIDAGHKNTRIYAVDPWAGSERNGEQQDMLRGRTDGDFGLFVDMMRKNAPEELERINVLRIESVFAAKLFREILSDPDMVMLDGDHHADAVEYECQLWPEAVGRGGWLCGDDYRDIYPTVAEGVHRVFPKERVELCGENGWTWRVKL